MKRLLSLSVCLMIAMLSFAYDFAVDGICYDITSSSEPYTVAVTYKGYYISYLDDYYTGSVTIPESVTYSGNSYSVTEIGYGAFYNCRDLTSVTIPNSVSSIDQIAFSQCYKLTSITIPNSVTSIGRNAFSGSKWYDNQTDGLVYAGKVAYKYKGTMPANTAIVLAEGTLGIAIDAFEGCSGLTSINIPNSVTSIGGSAFRNCSGLTSITIPNSVTSIDGSAFSGCSGLTSITIPNSVTTIGGGAFEGCSGLTSITIPNSVTTIGGGAFEGCSGLTSITIPNSVTSIGGSAFSGCSGLTSITIPNSVTSISQNAFSGCSGLTSITIPNSVTSISQKAFSGCSGLTSVTIPINVTSISSSAFEGCSNMASVDINSNVILSKKYTSSSSLKDIFGTQVQKYIIGNEVTSIGNYTFSGCDGLTSVTIPSSVTSIGNSAFEGCSGLEKVVVKDIAAWCKIPFGSSSTNPLSYAKHIYSDEATEITDLVIPDGVTSIGNYTFSGCIGMTSLTIPSSVTSIGSSAFSGCSGLEKVIVKDIAAWCKIPFSSNSDNPLYYAKHLYSDENTEIANLVIPDGVTSIGGYTFSGCSGLTSVTIPSSVTSINSSAFSGCGNLTCVEMNSNTILSKNYTSSSSLKNVFGTQVQKYIIGNDVKNIGKYAFNGCTDLASINIPSSVTSIGEKAFEGCSGLEKVIVKDLAAWCKVSFYNSFANPLFYSKHLYSDENTEITDLVIPNSVTSISSCAFSGCDGLTSVTIPNSVTSIGVLAFSGCTGLTSVTIPESVTSIEGSTFYDCTSLTSVTIPNSVTSIGNSAFDGCSSLTVTLPDGVTSIGNFAFSNVKKVLVNRGTSSLIALWKAGYAPKQIGTEESLPAPKLTVTGQTQTSLSYKIENWYDGYEYYYYSNVDKKLSKSAFTDKSLAPNSSGGTVYIRVPGTKSPEYAFSSDAKTLQFNPTIAQTTKTASSFILKGMYSEGDAVVTKQVLSVGGKSVEGNEISLKGLTPNSSYSAKYVVTITYGNKQTRDYTKEVKYNTDPLTLTTEQPKVVSLGNVIVSAKANVDDEEENVGFEWRRTDWTSDFASNTGTANMYEGTMEGYIRNLNTDKLWKFRPYYLADDGTYFYGDWIGLDPTNTSYFNPTVHTYAKIDVTGNTALVKGYALGGTDNITVQGFKYWKADANLARAEYGDRTETTAVTIPANAETIEAEGRVMEATLSGLDYESTYYYVAFAKTAEGTFYGDVKTFTTGINTTGIEAIYNSPSEIHISAPKGIYTLTGVKVSDDAADVKTLKSGIYIVNGKKVAVK